MSTKMHKLTGLSFEDVKKTFLEKGSSLDMTEYEVFWDGFEGSGRSVKQNSSDLINVLIKMAFDWHDGSKHPYYTLQSIFLTLNFLALNYSLDSNKLRPLLEQFKRNKNQYMDTMPSLDSIFKNIEDNILLKTPSSLERLIKSAATFFEISLQSDIPGNEERKSSFHIPRVLDGVDCHNVEDVFLYSHIRKLAMENNAVLFNQVIDLTLHHLRVTVPQHMKFGLLRAQTTVLALIHVMMQLLVLHPLIDTGILQRAITTLRIFFLWPNPVGISAQRALLTFQNEFQAPGSAIRKRLMNESLLASTRTPNDTFGRFVLAILDKDSASSATMSSMLGFVHYEDADRPTPDITRVISPMQMACAIMNMLFCDGLLDQQAIHAITSLNEIEVLQLYTQATTISARATKHKPTDALGFRQRELGAYAQAIRAGYTGDPHPFQPPNPGYVPDYSEMAYISIPTSIHIGFPESKTNFPLAPSELYPMFIEVLSRYQLQSSTDDPVNIPIAIVGGDSILHNVLIATQTLRIQNPVLYNRFNLNFYLIPFYSNRCASFLAIHDAWYNRHVYAPFLYNLNLLLPPQKAGTQPNFKYNYKAKNMLSPSRFLRTILDQYITEAPHSFSFRVFRVDAWIRPDASSSNSVGSSTSDFHPDIVIPFCERLECGVGVAAKIFQDSVPDYEKKNARVPLQALVKMKGFSYTPLDVHVSFVTVGPDSKPVDTIADEQLSFQRVILSNVPRLGEDDHVFPADPKTDWLEMYAQQTESSRARSKSRRLVLRSRQHVNFVDIMCSNKKDSFKILVDGNIMGPFFRICIKPLVTDQNEPVFFPIRTYFPIIL